MHDLMYGPRSKYIGEDLSKMFTGLPKGSPQKEKALEEAQGILKDFGKSGMTTYSIPGKDYEIERYSKVDIEFYDFDFKNQNRTYEWREAIIVQHEVDHLSGITFHKRAQKFHLDKAKKDRKMQKRYRKRHENNT